MSSVIPSKMVSKDLYFPIYGLIGVRKHENKKSTLCFESRGASHIFYEDIKNIVNNYLRIFVPWAKCKHRTGKEHGKGIGRFCVLIPLPSYSSALNAFDWLMSFWKGNTIKLYFGIRYFEVEKTDDIRVEVENVKSQELASQTHQPREKVASELTYVEETVDIRAELEKEKREELMVQDDQLSKKVASESMPTARAIEMFAGSSLDDEETTSSVLESSSKPFLGSEAAISAASLNLSPASNSQIQSSHFYARIGSDSIGSI